MGDMNGGNYSMNNHTRYGFININILYQCDGSRNFKEMDDNVEKGDVSSGYGYMNGHVVNQYNGYKSLMNDNYRDDMDMNANLHNGDVSSGIGLLNSHTPPQYNQSRNLN